VLYAVLERAGAAGLPLAALRAAAWGAVGVLLLNPSCHRDTTDRVTVLLDGSRSMTEAAGGTRWRTALDTARALAGRDGQILVFGAEPHVLAADSTPSAMTSRLLPALREAAVRGGRLVVVTDGEVDDAGAIPDDLLRAARVVIVPRPPVPDAGVAALALPAALRAGDTATATVDVTAAGTAPGDTVVLELLERGRRVASTRVALGAGGTVRRDLPFVPAPVGSGVEERRYQARLTGFARDGEPRDDELETAAAVSQASAITLVSDAPDWDFRRLTETLAATSGVPVRAYVKLGASGWRDAHTMHPVAETTVRSEAANAALVVAHGTADAVRTWSRLARRAAWEWNTVPRAGDPAPAGDWYVTPAELASPIGAALSAIPADSLPPLDLALDLRTDSAAWLGLAAQADRRGRPRAMIEGRTTGGRRQAIVGATGLWRWSSRGGVAAEAYRALVASLTDWLLEDRGGAPPGLLALRDSLAGGTGEFLPRRAVLAAQPGIAAAGAGEPEPVRFRPWLYLVALAAVVIEWVARRRRGLR